jgi:RNA polymerase sigma-70 factor (ECF subfamily)
MTIYHPDFRFLPEEAPDIREFEAFWRRVYGRLHRLVERRYDAADADEIVQETMLRCYENWSRLDPERDAWPWLTVVARRIATDHARARIRRADLETAAVPPLVDPSRPDDEVCARELTETVHRALHAMADADRTVLSLHHLDGLPTAEIASLTGRTDTAVRQHLFRARPRLAVVLRRLLDGPAGMLAPVGVWLRRWRKALAGSASGGGAVAACCLSVVTALTFGVVTGAGVLHHPRTARQVESMTAARGETPTVERSARRAVPSARQVRRAPARGRPAEATMPLPPPAVLTTSGDPLYDPEQPSEQQVVVDVIPGKPVGFRHFAENTPGHTVLCTLPQVRCTD